jgi:N-acetylmuramoyl-L-alanine amidase
MIIVGTDDGHGIQTEGKRSPDGYKENFFNHPVKAYLNNDLIRNGFKVVDCSPTRDDNSLQDRIIRANNGKCNIFISIHFNAMGNNWSSTQGIETFYHGNSTEGKKLADSIHHFLLQGTKQSNRGVKSDFSLFKTGFYVLRKTNMPAVLCECGFMDNKYERKLMESEEFQKECAAEICKGICHYFGIQYKSTEIITASKIRHSCLSDPDGWDKHAKEKKFFDEYTLKVFNCGRKYEKEKKL